MANISDRFHCENFASDEDVLTEVSEICIRTMGHNTGDAFSKPRKTSLELNYLNFEGMWSESCTTENGWLSSTLPSTPRHDSDTELGRYSESHTDLDTSESSFSLGKRSARRHWTSEEDRLLIEAVSEMGEGQWKLIANKVGTRNHTQCLQRWKKALCPGLRKGQWSRDEDEMLIFQVSEGHRNWGQLASHMPGRTSKQCRERWIHHLDPDIKKTEYSHDEDALIISLQKQLGNRWSEISRHVKGRTENAVKIRWKAITRFNRVNPQRWQSNVTNVIDQDSSPSPHLRKLSFHNLSLNTSDIKPNTARITEKPKLIEIAAVRASKMLKMDDFSNAAPVFNKTNQDTCSTCVPRQSYRSRSLSPVKPSRPIIVPPLTPQCRPIKFQPILCDSKHDYQSVAIHDTDDECMPASHAFASNNSIHSGQNLDYNYQNALMRPTDKIFSEQSISFFSSFDQNDDSIEFSHWNQHIDNSTFQTSMDFAGIEMNSMHDSVESDNWIQAFLELEAEDILNNLKR